VPHRASFGPPEIPRHRIQRNTCKTYSTFPDLQGKHADLLQKVQRIFNLSAKTGYRMVNLLYEMQFMF
jgi:hypothetical protein